ncbi:MAG TPA: hypothetical protein VK422_08545 [Pyrinomonadaceae bacterium]|nr:hypothetical protein [Pyrinomonadaceae bacterium]
MFCPKCSQAQPAEDLRFCPRCGFPLVAVKELLGREERGDDGAGAGEEWRLPAQKDLATGALLMFAGSVVAVLWGFVGARGPAEVLLPQAYFILGGTLAFLLTLFHPLLRSLERLFSGGGPSPHLQGRRDGINLGALLMFVGALKATMLTSGMHPGLERGLTALAFVAGMLLLTLLLRPVLRAAHGLLFKRDKSADSPTAEVTARLESRERGSALPPAQSVPVNDFRPSSHDTAELAAPPSVVEEPTRKL